MSVIVYIINIEMFKVKCPDVVYFKWEFLED